jgi:DNA-binding XRE family transcriptional regulator
MALSPRGRKETPAKGAGQVWVVRKALDLRMQAGLTQVELTVEAHVGRDSIGRVERNEPVTERIAMKIFNALNKKHGGKLNEKDYVKIAGRSR